jgi:hypothetical protein
MKIIALPDLHEDVKSLYQMGRALSEVDLVLLVGDLTNGSVTSQSVHDGRGKCESFVTFCFDMIGFDRREVKMQITTITSGTGCIRRHHAREHRSLVC